MLLVHQPAEALGDAVKALLETGARTGDVDAHIAIETLHLSGVDPDLLFEL